MDYYQTPLSELEFVAFDTETTGLSSTSRLIEIAGLRFSLDREIGQFPGTLIDPEMPIPPESIRIHHITDDMVQGQPKVEEVLGKFFDFCQGALLIAHNAPFDLRMIRGEVQRLNLTSPQLTALDTRKLARPYIELSNYRLATLIEHYQLQAESSMHRAFQDTWMVKEIFVKMLDTLTERELFTPQTSLRDLLKGASLDTLDANPDATS